MPEREVEPEGGDGREGHVVRDVDPRVLGQILAAQNLLFVLHSERQIAAFFSGWSGGAAVGARLDPDGQRLRERAEPAR